METLLDKARKISKEKKRENHSQEEIELVLGWLAGEVSTSQVGIVKNRKSGNILYFIAVVLREAYKKDQLKIIN